MVYLPSGIISNKLSAAENVSRATNFPIPDGMPLKSSLFSFRNNLRTFVNLHKPAGNEVISFLDRIKVSSFCQISIPDAI